MAEATGTAAIGVVIEVVIEAGAVDVQVEAAGADAVDVTVVAAGGMAVVTADRVVVAAGTRDIGK